MNTKKIFTIGDPCHEDWQSMTPTEKGRFCDVCAKCVIDLRGKSQNEIQDLYVANEGNLCGTMSPDQYKESQKQVAKAKAKLEGAMPQIVAQANSIYSEDGSETSPGISTASNAADRASSRFNITRAAMRRMQIFAASFIAAFGMFWNSTVNAQIDRPLKGKIAAPMSSRASGTVMHNGKPVAGATVNAYHSTSGERHETQTDGEGRFFFHDLEPGEWIFSAWDEHDLEGSATRSLRRGGREEVRIEMEIAMMMGDIAPIEMPKIWIEEPKEWKEEQLKVIEGPKELKEEPEELIEEPLGTIKPIEIEEPQLIEEEIEVKQVDHLQVLGGIRFHEVEVPKRMETKEKPTGEVEPCQLVDPAAEPEVAVPFNTEDMIDGGITFYEVEVTPEEIEPGTGNENAEDAVNEAEGAQELKITSENFEVTVKPVPTRTDFTIRIDKSVSEKPIELLLFSTEGKLVRTGVISGAQGSTTRMDISMLPAGIYFLKGLQNDYIFEEKVLKL